MSPSRRTGWVVLAAVVATVLGGTVTLRRRRHRRPDPLVPVARVPVSVPAAGSSPTDPARSLVRMAVGAGVVVVLAIVAVVVTRPSTPTPRTAIKPIPYPQASGPWSGPVPLSLAVCQASVAEQIDPGRLLTCGYETAGLDRAYDEPSADPSDPRYIGAALPTGLSTDGRICVAGSERPVLDTVRPTLSASFPATGLRLIESTFQLTGVYGRTAEDLQLPGDHGDPLTATLDLSRQTALKHGESYRWRVRGTPPSVGAAGWSPWCEFTIPETTPDDLGLDDARDYRAVLAATEWRDILTVLTRTHPDGADPAYAPVQAAVKATQPSATRVPVTLNGRAWSELVNSLAYTASQNDEPSTWKLADSVSSALGGPDRPTMGFPRTH